MEFAPRPPSVLDYVAGLPRALLRAIDGSRKPERTAAGFCAVLDPDLPVFYSGSTGATPLGIAGAPGMPEQAVILAFNTTSRESRRAVKRIRQAAVFHRRRHPRHTILFLCNTPNEVALLGARGEAAILLNQNLFVSERAFRPLPPRPVLHDAVYNARLAPWKRHELTLAIERCAFIYYRTAKESAAAEAAIRERHRRLAPGHVFINPLNEKGEPVLLGPKEVNAVYNDAAVGLCLSAKEGANFATVECLLSGLPFVSTPSIGGRDAYFDPDYCIIAEPDPRAVRDAVVALRDRRIPRDYIASRTLARMAVDRQRLLRLLDDLREQAGASRLGLAAWPYAGERVIRWDAWGTFLAEAAAAGSGPARPDATGRG